MGARTAAREAALQMLYAADFGQQSVEALLRDFWREFPGDAEGRSYADAAVRGVLEQREAIDARVTSASVNWRLERMSPIARNVLRLGTWELLYQPDVPRAVIIDESVEVAKRYGGSESGSFVNGVLDRIADGCGRVDKDLPPRSRSAAASSPPAERAGSSGPVSESPASDDAVSNDVVPPAPEDED
jgi:N utilization substance protein B